MQESTWSLKELEWRRLTAAACTVAAVSTTAILVARLPASNLALSAGWILATALMVSALGAGAIAALTVQAKQVLSADARSALAVLFGGLTSLATFATAAQASTLAFSLACVVSLACSSAFIAWAFLFRPAAPSAIAEQASSSSDPISQTVPFEPAPRMPEATLTGTADEATPPLPEHIDQTLSRYTIEGRDHLEACVRVRFEAGQQTAIVHLPIQPAMHFDPEVECEPLGKEELRVTVDPAQPYGVRLVCRRAAPWTEAGNAVIAVLISSDRMARAAA